MFLNEVEVNSNLFQADAAYPQINLGMSIFRITIISDGYFMHWDPVASHAFHSIADIDNKVIEIKA